MELVVIIKYKHLDESFDAVTTIEHKNTFNTVALSEQTNNKDDAFHIFNKYMKRYLLKSFERSFTPVSMVVKSGDIETVHTFLCNENRNILKVDYDFLGQNGYSETFPTKGSIIRKSLEFLYEKFEIKNKKLFN